ncbi:hypothetical protein, partial [Calothrix sp. UHCC 0171]|uniref:hypothetical protein n=1 Tax=Calothrix sp. UHCC 0171 TaxID=3110245 RepID=UPI002B1FF8CA
KMGVPMIAADWAGLRGATAYESRKNLREFLQFCDANGEYGLVLYFDDLIRALLVLMLIMMVVYRVN